jgi:bifunctional UDP-N-acetylglucosamine pyrophosphorylase/glucosamine-1-phosphate N-acetyltransferase
VRSLKAIILSAGEGIRMRPLTLTKPKTMLFVGVKPIIQHNIEALRNNGVIDILLIVNYKESIVKNYFKDGKDFGVNISYKTQKELSGTANAIEHGKDFVNGEFIVLNGDIICLDKDIISNIIKTYYKNKPDTLMVLTKVKNPSNFGVVELEGNIVKNIVEKPGSGEALSNYINTGIYIFNKDIFKKISKTKKSKRGEYEITDSLDMQIEDGKTILGIISKKKWFDVGHPWELIGINEHFFKSVQTNIKGKIEPGAHMNENSNIHLGEGSIIRSGAYIDGSVYIGDNCDIGPNCYIRGNNHFGDNVKIGNAVEIKNSIIMDNTNINHLSYVGDSVIGANCNLGAGTIVANLRFDDKNVKTMIKNEKIDSGRLKLGVIFGDFVKTGINSSFSPGVKVGSNSIIGSDVLLYEDIGPNKIVLLKQEHKILEKK